MHHAVGVELSAGVANVLADGVNADEEPVCNLLWTKSLRQQPEHLELPGCEPQARPGRWRIGFVNSQLVGRCLIKHMYEYDLVGFVGGDKRNDRNALVLAGGALHSDVRHGRDLSAPGRNDTRAVLDTDRSLSIESKSPHHFVAFATKNIVSFVSEDLFSLRIPEHYSLVEIDSVSPVRRGIQTVE